MAGRVLISVGVLALLVAIVVVNMPPSVLRHDAGRYTLPVTNAVGLGQDWSIFSQPRTISAYVDARVDFADGSSTVRGISTGHWLSAYVDYRWQKYEESIRPDEGRKYWHDYATYVASRVRTPGHEPVRVTLYRRFAQTLPPGSTYAHGPWTEVTMYVLDLGRGR